MAADLAIKDIHTLLSLCMWELWKHRNAVVFDGATPSSSVVFCRIGSEGRAWELAGLLKGDSVAFLGALATWPRASSLDSYRLSDRVEVEFSHVISCKILMVGALSPFLL